MRTIELVVMALRAILGNPMRTILTMLGVIIGVSSVVTLVAIGQGAQVQIEKQYENLGTNLIVANVLGRGRAQQLDYNDLMQLEMLPEIGAMAPTVNKNNSNVKFEHNEDQFNVVGTNDRYLEMMKGEMASGRFLVDGDLEFRSSVAVLGSETATTLFPGEDPLGKVVTIEGISFNVIGVMQKKGSTIGGTSLDTSVIVPLETARRTFKIGSITTTYVEAATKDDLTQAQTTLTQYLTYKFKSSNGFRLLNQDQLMNARVAASSTLTNQLISVACISLLVGGIGIMNIMLVTISERTREIGIRKSIGAKRRNILLQFLVEAAVISSLGGLIGLILGCALSWAIPLINPAQATKLSLDVGIYAFLFSALVGIIFGLYPANKASKLRPIDALRFD
ncbi:MAG: macrolide export ATP-binding/permease macB [Paenibacillaceae bacterium]|nr:macrolide export ATP-binding/permease macB [Paenibacillaceae bacterium]